MTATIGHPCIGCSKPETLAKITCIGFEPICEECLWSCEMAFRAELARLIEQHAPPKRGPHDMDSNADLDRFDGVPADTCSDRYALMDYNDENPRGFGGGDPR